MKVIISENKIDKVIRKYLDETYYPDYGWSNPDVYQTTIKQYGDCDFFINDLDSYIYYGCTAGVKDDRHFDPNDGKLRWYECPLLSIYPRVSEELTSLFGNRWLPVFKEWFEENTGLEVAQITNDYI